MTLADETKVKAQARYEMDLNQVRQTLDDNAIVPYRIDLTGRELVCHEIKGGNIIKLVSKPPEVEVFWNSTKDRGSAMLLNDLNRGIIANKLNKNGERMFFENFYLWTEGIPNDINSDKHLYVEVAGVGNEISFLLGNQSHIELIAAQMKQFEDMIDKLNTTIANMNDAINQSLLSNRLVLEEQAQYLTRLAMRQGALSSADIVPIQTSIVRNPLGVRPITAPITALPARILSDSLTQSFTASNIASRPTEPLGYGSEAAFKIIPDKTIIADITVEYRLCNISFGDGTRNSIAASGNKNLSVTQAMGWGYMILNNVPTEQEGVILEANQAIMIGRERGKNVGDLCLILTAKDVYLEAEKEYYLMPHIHIYIGSQGVISKGSNHATNSLNMYTLLSFLRWYAASSFLRTNITYKIKGIGDIENSTLVPEVIVPEVIEDAEEDIFVQSIIIQLIRTADTENDSIGLRDLQFVNFDGEVLPVIPNISGNSGQVMFQINNQIYTATFSLDCNDAPDSTKNQIFEENGWISGSTIKNRAYTLTLEFDDNNPNSKDIKTISVVNGNAVLDAQGNITEGASWVQTIALKLVDTKDEIIASEIFNFGSNGMKAEIEVPQPIDPNIPTPPEPEPELGELQQIEILASGQKGGYNALGARDFCFLTADSQLIYADTPLPANQSAVGSVMEGTFTIDDEVYNYTFQIYYADGREGRSYSDSVSYRKSYTMANTGYGYLSDGNSATAALLPFKFEWKFDKALPVNIIGISMRNSSTNSTNAGFLQATVNFKDGEGNVLKSNEHTFTALNTIFQSLYLTNESEETENG